jgi:hypothetical protein
VAENNGIALRQMEERNLNRLAAQRQLYSDGKLIVGVQLILNVVVIILITLIAMAAKSPTVMTALGYTPIDFSWIVTVSGIVITVIDNVLWSRLVDSFREKAAKIQDAFDCDILKIPWSSISAGERPNTEDVYQSANKFKNKRGDSGIKGLENWYCVEVNGVPLPIARIICQRSNIWWDAELRNKFNRYVVAIAATLFLVLLVLGIWGDLTLRSFFTIVIAPFLPMLIFSYKEYKKNKDTINSLKSLRSIAEAEYDAAIKPQAQVYENDYIGRELQNKIYLHRKSSPLIFDFFYNRYRDINESSMNVSCKELVDQYWQSRR